MREQAALFLEPQILTGMCIFIFGVGSVYVFLRLHHPLPRDGAWHGRAGRELGAHGVWRGVLFSPICSQAGSMPAWA